MSWQVLADAFHTSRHQLPLSLEQAVAWGREHTDFDGITAIGVDELAWAPGHQYVSVVYQINERWKRLLSVKFSQSRV